MDSVIRAAAIYLLMLIVFRIAGNRSLAQLTAFDLVLLLIISEGIQQAMITSDYSFTNAALLVITLVGLDIMLSLWKRRFPSVGNFLDGRPVLLIADGKMQHEAMNKERVDTGDILSAAREKQGLESLDQVKHAVVEPSGGITIVPKEL